MPLVATACLAYALGLLGAFTLSSPALLAAAGLALAAGAVLLLGEVGRRPFGLCLLVGAAGAIAGAAARHHADDCARTLAHASALRVTLDGDAAAGALVHGVVRETECVLPTTLLVPGDATMLGQYLTVEITGTTGSTFTGSLLRERRPLPMAG